MTQKRWANLAGDLIKQSSDVDNRLTAGQLHMMVVAALNGEEPLVLAAEIVGLSRDYKSKVEMSDTDAAKLLVMISDRIYEMETRAPKRGTHPDQFTLSFSWADRAVTEEVQ
jgi:hypothetical protein